MLHVTTAITLLSKAAAIASLWLSGSTRPAKEHQS